MAISADILDLDMNIAKKRLEEKGCTIKQSDDLMLIFDWKGIETTLYPQGKVMFFPLKDKTLCIKYSTEILESLR